MIYKKAFKGESEGDRKKENHFTQINKYQVV